jgi:hypothetical protein
LNISILNPLDHPGWDALLLTSERAAFSHTTSWARVLSDSYGYRPLYFTIVENGKLAGLIPVMEIDSWLTGRRGVSLPFTDICHPIADTPDIFRALMESLTQHGNSKGWKYIEFKGGAAQLDGAPHCAEHFTHVLELSEDEAGLNKTFRGSSRRNIRHAEKAGVEVRLSHARDALADFYRLHCLTRQRHGLPPQPWSFFSKIHEHVIARDHGFVALGVHEGRTIAGAVYFHFQDRALYKYGASDRIHQHLRANNLIMWEAIRWFSCNGFRSLHFGRTEPENQGLLQFKRGWGTEEGRVAYYKLNIRENAFAAARNDTTSYLAFKLLPIPVLRLAGSVLYRHVG